MCRIDQPLRLAKSPSRLRCGHGTLGRYDSPSPGAIGPFWPPSWRWHIWRRRSVFHGRQALPALGRPLIPVRATSAVANRPSSVGAIAAVSRPSSALAWAAAHQVEPPAELAEALSAEDTMITWPVAIIGTVANIIPPWPLAANITRPCKRRRLTPRPIAWPEQKKSPGHGFQKFKCHGISTLWVINGAVAPPAAVLAWTFDWSIAGTVPPLLCSTVAVEHLPAVPPPRVAAAPCLADLGLIAQGANAPRLADGAGDLGKALLKRR